MTFTMERKDAILTVEDSIRKLQLLDARGKVWIQDLVMSVNESNIELIDSQTMVSTMTCINFYFIACSVLKFLAHHHFRVNFDKYFVSLFNHIFVANS